MNTLKANELSSLLFANGSLEVFEQLQADHLANRLSCVYPLSSNDLKIILLLLLAHQRKGNTAFNLETLHTLGLPVDWHEEIHSLFASLKTQIHGSENELLKMEIWKGKEYWGFQRAWKSEVNIASQLTQRIQESYQPLNVSPVLPESYTLHQRQVEAIETSINHSFTILSGGPGTGKTTVVKQILLSLLQCAEIQVERIVLCAPTGRAKARLEASVKSQLATNSPLQKLQSKTLHSLLGMGKAQTSTFHRTNLLPYDLIIIDEVSMVDSAMFSQFLEAAPPHCRLVLVGDMNQLPSVESGAVLGDLSQGWRLFLKERFVELTKVYRSDQSILEWWETQLNPTENTLSFTRNPQIISSDEELLEGVFPKKLSALHTLWKALNTQGFQAPSIEQYLEFWKVLVLTNQGPSGRKKVNQYLHKQWQLTTQKESKASPYLPGEPVLLNQNQRIQNLELFNGDLGVVLNIAGEIVIGFPKGDQLHTISPKQLIGLEHAWAMTVHKSQGSEFDHILLIVPPKSTKHVSKQLVYTGITRTKKELTLFDPEANLSNMVDLKRETWLAHLHPSE